MPLRPLSSASSMSFSPSPSAKHTVFLLSRVTLMNAFVRSCSESLFTRSRLSPRWMTIEGQGPFTSSSLARAGRAMGSTNSVFTCGESPS